MGNKQFPNAADARDELLQRRKSRTFFAYDGHIDVQTSFGLDGYLAHAKSLETQCWRGLQAFDEISCVRSRRYARR